MPTGARSGQVADERLVVVYCEDQHFRPRQPGPDLSRRLHKRAVVRAAEPLLTQRLLELGDVAGLQPALLRRRLGVGDGPQGAEHATTCSAPRDAGTAPQSPRWRPRSSRMRQWEIG